MPFGGKSESILLEERDGNRTKFFPTEDLIPVAVLMIRSRIFLEVYASATKEIFECKENVLIFLDKFYVEFWFYHHSSSDCFLCIGISHIDSKAAFTVYQTYYIFRVKILH